MKALILILILSLPTASFAKKVRLASPAERLEYIRNADVWLNPPWISENFAFDPSLDLASGPDAVGEDKLFLLENVYCRQNQEQSVKPYSGKTRKFFCDLLSYDYGSKTYAPVLKANGKIREIKVKYHEPKREFPAEVITTRFLWALGFAADRMYFVNNVYCWNCTIDPFEIRGLDPLSEQNPRRFFPVAIETKFEGEEIVITKDDLKKQSFIDAEETKEREGWKFGELKYVSKTDKDKRRAQRIERDALMLLSVFIQHSDNKMANQRLVCLGEVSADGKCLGRTIMMLQDVGATFGEGREGTFFMSFLDYKGWTKKPIWFDAEKCLANLGMNFDLLHVKYPSISEEGRQFLLKLLEGFSSGTIGKARIRQMFAAGYADRHGHSLDEWIATFIGKVEQIKYPMGRENADFTCPRRVK